MAKYLKIPNKIIDKSPSPDLIPGITDEFAMGISYKELDQILYAKENNGNLNDFDKAKVERVEKILKNSNKKRIKALHL